MAREVVHLKDINDTSDLWTVAVRIIDLWEIINRAGHKHIEMVCVDTSGQTIQVIVPKDQAFTMKNDLKEDKTFEVENLMVHANDLPYKISTHKYKIVLTSGTILWNKDFPTIPKKTYAFKSFAEILKGDFKSDLLVDIIGAVQGRPFSQLQKDLKRVVVNLMDVSGHVINCTLWQALGYNFLIEYNQLKEAGPVVLILTHARIKEGQTVSTTTYPPSVSSSFSGSKVILDTNMLEIKQFIKDFPNVLATCSSQGMSQGGGNSQLSLSQESKFMAHAQLKTIKQIIELRQETTCVTIGTTGKIVPSDRGWSYQSCSGCSKKATKIDSPFTCECGHYSETAIPRYRIEIRVYHGKHNYKFVFWDSDCAAFVEETCLELQNKLIQAGRYHPKSYPKPLDKILNRTLAFKVHVQPNFSQGSVSWLNSDPDFIKKLQDQLEPNEQTSRLVIQQTETDNTLIKNNTHEEHRIDSQPIQLGESSQQTNNLAFATQSLGSIGENELEILGNITPCKRLSYEANLHDNLADQFMSPQLSSTKLKMNIKQEK